MNKRMAKWTLGLALAAPVLCAQAASVTLSSWLYGSGGLVSVADASGAFNGRAGGLNAALTGAGDFDTSAFATFSLEYGTDPRIGRAISGYSLVSGASYFERRLGDAGLAGQVARLMSYAVDNSSLVNNASGSAALQVAIWALIQDQAAARGDTPPPSGLASSNVLAQSLLAGGQTVTDIRFDVWVLERGTSPDLLLLTARAAPLAEPLPEPGSLPLALTALAGLAVAAQRRRLRASN